MQDILVISPEPALAETLASELPERNVLSARPQEAETVDKSTIGIILVDDIPAQAELLALLPTATIPIVKLVRPVRLSSLLYTIYEHGRRSTGAPKEDIPLLENYILCPNERLMRSVDGTTRVALTEKEVELLLCLLETREQTVSRDTLLKRIWGYNDDIATHTLETHIYRLRGKLRQLGETLDIVSSEEGGYRLSPS